MYIMDRTPDLEELLSCVNQLAKVMHMSPLPVDLSINLIEHVLYDEKRWNVKGKKILDCLSRNLLTEREARNVLMAHSATNISSFNQAPEVNCFSYMSKELCEKFEIALIGRVVKLREMDLLDPWEVRNA